MEVFPETDSDAPRTPDFVCPVDPDCTWQTLEKFLVHVQTGGELDVWE